MNKEVKNKEKKIEYLIMKILALLTIISCSTL